jgi:hypothetical protein
VVAVKVRVAELAPKWVVGPPAATGIRVRIDRPLWLNVI